MSAPGFWPAHRPAPETRARAPRQYGPRHRSQPLQVAVLEEARALAEGHRTARGGRTRVLRLNERCYMAQVFCRDGWVTMRRCLTYERAAEYLAERERA